MKLKKTTVDEEELAVIRKDFLAFVKSHLQITKGSIPVGLLYVQRDSGEDAVCFITPAQIARSFEEHIDEVIELFESIRDKMHVENLVEIPPAPEGRETIN